MDPEAGVGGEAIAPGRIKFLRASQQIEGPFLQCIGCGGIIRAELAVVLSPAEGHQGEVVADELIAGALAPFANGPRCLIWATGMVLPVLNQTGQLQNAALRQGRVQAAQPQPVAHGWMHARSLR